MQTKLWTWEYAGLRKISRNLPIPPGPQGVRGWGPLSPPTMSPRPGATQTGLYHQVLGPGGISRGPGSTRDLENFHCGPGSTRDLEKFREISLYHQVHGKSLGAPGLCPFSPPTLEKKPKKRNNSRHHVYRKMVGGRPGSADPGRGLDNRGGRRTPSRTPRDPLEPFGPYLRNGGSQEAVGPLVGTGAARRRQPCRRGPPVADHRGPASEKPRLGAPFWGAAGRRRPPDVLEVTPAAQEARG